MKRLLMISSLFLLLGACYPVYITSPYHAASSTYRVLRVETTASWQATINNQQFFGTGTQSIPVDHSPVCWTVLVTSPSVQVLRVFLTHRNYHTHGAYARYQDQVTLSGRVQSCHI